MSEVEVLETLEELEGIVFAGLKTFSEVGTALLKIQERRLYKDSHPTFVDYCRERFGIMHSRAYQLMDAAKTVSGMSTVVDNEAHARELKRVPAAQRDEVYAEAGPKPTAVRIRTAVEKRRPDAKPKGKPQRTPQEWTGEYDWERDSDRDLLPDDRGGGHELRAVGVDQVQEVVANASFMAGVHEALANEAAGVQPRTIEQITTVLPEIAVEYSGYIAALAFDQPDPMGFVKALQPGFLRAVKENIGPAIAWLQRVEAYL